MIPDSSKRTDLRLIKNQHSFSQRELQEETKKVLREMYDLLEQFAPAWYPQELHQRAESVLRSLEKQKAP
jgi:hypothetical protein